jgi:hypothetical protein
LSSYTTTYKSAGVKNIEDNTAVKQAIQKITSLGKTKYSTSVISNAPASQLENILSVLNAQKSSLLR